MNISRANYEIWFTDWLDNNLSASQAEELENFLAENPDLREEFTALSEFNLKAEPSSYPFKDKIRKSPADLSPEQFDMLCVSLLEKDLLPEQEAGLLEVIRSDSRKQKEYELIGKIKLVPPAMVYPHKNRLLKRTAQPGIIRLAVLSLSAAAIMAVMLLTGVLRQDSFVPAAKTSIAENASDGESSVHGDVLPEVLQEPSASRQLTEGTVAGKQPESAGKKASEEPGSGTETTSAVDRIPVEIEKIAFNPLPVLSSEPGNYLVETGGMLTSEFEPDERSRIGKFIAQTFREKILKDSTRGNSPLKGYEIAEAGVEGLNWLLGWEMALSRNNDENGNVKSVYFSSRTVKFQAPVKNNEPAE